MLKNEDFFSFFKKENIVGEKKNHKSKLHKYSYIESVFIRKGIDF